MALIKIPLAWAFLTIFGAIVLFGITMVGTSIYGFINWDMEAWSNVINWLHPRDNVLVRIVSLIGSIIAFFASWAAYLIEG